MGLNVFVPVGLVSCAKFEGSLTIPLIAWIKLFSKAFFWLRIITDIPFPLSSFILLISFFNSSLVTLDVINFPLASMLGMNVVILSTSKSDPFLTTISEGSIIILLAAGSRNS